METQQLYPLTFEPCYRDYLWGGRRMAEHFGRALPAGPCAESWEISDRRDAVSIADWGPHAGRTLPDLIERLGERLLGTRCRPGETTTGPFPLLVKIIDAQEILSLQVHPEDAAARAGGGDAKTEMWYVLATAPGARVYCGLREGARLEDLQALAHPAEASRYLREIALSPREAVFVPGGCVHAIGPGCLLLEIQQNSDTTYRVSDWGRVDAKGRARALHIEEAMGVIREPSPGAGRVEPARLPGSNAWKRRELSRCEHFQVEEWELAGRQRIPLSGERCEILFVAEGTVRIEASGVARELGAGTSVLVPAGCGQYAAEVPADQPALLIRALPGPFCS